MSAQKKTSAGYFNSDDEWIEPPKPSLAKRVLRAVRRPFTGPTGATGATGATGGTLSEARIREIVQEAIDARGNRDG